MATVRRFTVELDLSMPARPGAVPIVATLVAAWSFYRTQLKWIAPLGIGLGVLCALVTILVPLPGGSPPPAGAMLVFPLYAMAGLFVLSVLQTQGFGVVDPLVGLLALFAVAIACIGYWVVLLRRAMDKPASQAALGEDWARMARVFGAIWFLVFILLFVTMIVMATLLASAMSAAGVTQAEIQATQDNPEGAMALMDRALASSAGWMVWAGLALLAFGAAWLFARLALAGPATVAQNKAMAFGSWAYTKGDGLRIAVIYGVILAPLAVLSWALVALSPSSGQAGANGAGMIVLGTNMALILVQTLLTMPLMAGAGAFLYRGLKPPS
jgi:hypothetical protein